jgi:diketogulonate reductase-like aldo/keto reductase
MIYRTVRGVQVPALGFGTWHLRGPDAVSAVQLALEIGYRHVDTAARYENEAEVGQAIRQSGLPRDDIFLSTKLRHTELAPEGIEARTRDSLDRLGVERVDLLMPHWPVAPEGIAPMMQAFRRLRDLGLARFIGVSNFPTALLRIALDVMDGEVFANQVEYHPFLRQRRLLEMQRPLGIALTAAVPLARGKVYEAEPIRRIAEARGKSPAQVALRWLVQQDGVLAIPKSAQPDRIRSNYQIFDFALDADEMRAIDTLQGPGRMIDLAWAPEWDPAD